MQKQGIRTHADSVALDQSEQSRNLILGLLCLILASKNDTADGSLVDPNRWGYLFHTVIVGRSASENCSKFLVGAPRESKSNHCAKMVKHSPLITSQPVVTSYEGGRLLQGSSSAKPEKATFPCIFLIYSFLTCYEHGTSPKKLSTYAIYAFIISKGIFSSFIQNKNYRHKNDVFCQKLFFVAKNKMLVARPTFLRSLISLKPKAMMQHVSKDSYQGS